MSSPADALRFTPPCNITCCSADCVRSASGLSISCKPTAAAYFVLRGFNTQQGNYHLVVISAIMDMTTLEWLGLQAISLLSVLAFIMIMVWSSPDHSKKRNTSESMKVTAGRGSARPTRCRVLATSRPREVTGHRCGDGMLPYRLDWLSLKTLLFNDLGPKDIMLMHYQQVATVACCHTVFHLQSSRFKHF